MQRLPDGSFRFSPRDLIAYLEGDFAAWCERNHAERSSAGSGRQRHELIPDAKDAEADLAKRRGTEHEAAHLTRLRQQYSDLIEIAEGDDAFADTRRAMEQGASVIYQGDLQSNNWRGISDFLHRRDGTSTLGDFHYEPWDTKLALSAKPYFLLQLSCYAEMLEAMQGVRPAHLGFVFGDGAEQLFRTEDFWHYYRRLKHSFECFHAAWSPDNCPDPGLERSFGRWTTEAERMLRARDDLSLVANITRSQIVRLRDAGVDTVTQLATRVADVADMNARTLANLREQAEMQVATRSARTIQWKHRAVDPAQPRRGLALLPASSSHDVFFDIEGFPYAPRGLEYLLGVVTVDSGAPVFRDWWAHDDAEERRSFEAFIDWVHARWKAHPAMHVYHYASYERSAICRLMGKYGTREDEVDDLLRNEVLVDLFTVTRQALVIGTESYSLKYIEHLYMAERTEDVKSAGGSVIEYQRWIDERESRIPAESPILAGIRDYNRVDCESTVGLRDWLLVRQKEAGIAWMPLPKKDDVKKEDQLEVDSLVAELQTRAEALDDEPEQQRLTQLVAWLLEFHRREEKPWWWKYFERMKAEEKELYDDVECLAGLERTSTASYSIRQSRAFEYRYDPGQETKLEEGDRCALAGTADLKCTIERFVDREAGIIELCVGKKSDDLPDRVSLIPADLIRATAQRKALVRFAKRWMTDALHHGAIADLLSRRAPRDRSGTKFLFDDAGDATVQAIECVKALDNSLLCIQGPPGTGKTTTAAEKILSLLASGRRVGVVANGHQVILNLIERVAKLGGERNIAFDLLKVGGEEDHPLVTSGRMQLADSKAAPDLIGSSAVLIGGTAWLFSREEMEGKLDVLFIEEAGQFALANAIACAPTATNVVMLGDQNQLAQPTQGSHPGESGQSALEYFLDGSATIPVDRGIFLGKSYRMQPSICAFISEAYYEGRLTSAPITEKNAVIGAKTIDVGSGVRFVPVEHDGCTHSSDEECERVKELVDDLLTCTVRIGNDAPRAMTIDDILIVAPFNMQVRALRNCLPNARIASVDKFQGQEAPVVIVTMCASTLEDAPRGPQFLLSKNRLNVAISRAQALALVVGSPKIGDVRVRSVQEMELVSGWCRIEESQRT